MNSHNNIKWGSVDTYLYERMGGLSQSGASIAWSQIVVRPGVCRGVCAGEPHP